MAILAEEYGIKSPRELAEAIRRMKPLDLAPFCATPEKTKEDKVGWNGNYKVPCFYCKKKFMVKRTRLHHTTPITANENAKEAIER